MDQAPMFDLRLGQPPLRTVILQHDVPDGSVHFDWLVARDEAGSQPLVTFRLVAPIHLIRHGCRVVAERIADHRPLYLDYEGLLSENRGAVRRIIAGHVTSISEAQFEVEDAAVKSEQTLMLQIEWRLARAENCDLQSPGCSSIKQKFRLKPQNSSQWTVICDSMEFGIEPSAQPDL